MEDEQAGVWWLRRAGADDSRGGTYTFRRALYQALGVHYFRELSLKPGKVATVPFDQRRGGWNPSWGKEREGGMRRLCTDRGMGTRADGRMGRRKEGWVGRQMEEKGGESFPGELWARAALQSGPQSG